MCGRNCDIPAAFSVFCILDRFLSSLVRSRIKLGVGKSKTCDLIVSIFVMYGSVRKRILAIENWILYPLKWSLTHTVFIAITKRSHLSYITERRATRIRFLFALPFARCASAPRGAASRHRNMSQLTLWRPLGVLSAKTSCSPRVIWGSITHSPQHETHLLRIAKNDTNKYDAKRWR